MKKLLFYTLFYLSFFTVSAQPTFKYKNPCIFKGESVVFTMEYEPHFLLKDISGRFTPTKQELDSTELIFKSRYNYDLQEPKELYVEPVKNVVKEYKHYQRQYLGIINSKGEKIIIIQMLNFKNAKVARRKFENWEDEFVIASGGFYEGNKFIFKVNLTTGKISK